MRDGAAGPPRDWFGSWAAPPGAGKTTWATNLGHEWALHGVPVAYVAGDEAREGILIRLPATPYRPQVPRGGCATGHLDDLEKHLQELPMLLVDPDEDVGVDVATVATALRRRWPVEGPAVIIIDSLQAMARRIPDDVSDTPRAKVDAFMKSCKAAAKRHQLVIICLSELARGAYRGGNDQTNDLAAAKESGAIEYEAGALCVLRPVEEEPGLVTVSWAKSRPGPGRAPRPPARPQPRPSPPRSPRGRRRAPPRRGTPPTASCSTSVAGRSDATRAPGMPGGGGWRAWSLAGAARRCGPPSTNSSRRGSCRTWETGSAPGSSG